MVKLRQYFGKIAAFVGHLSQVSIDADKDWNEKEISNLGGLQLPRGTTANIPASDKDARIYIANDTGKIWIVKGNKWYKSAALDIAVYGASDILILSSDDEVSASTFTKVKELILPNYGGTLRIKFDLRVSNSLNSAQGRIYKNGVALGTLRSTNSESYITYSEDLAGWNADDLIQLYLGAGSPQIGYARNFRVYASLE